MYKEREVNPMNKEIIKAMNKKEKKNTFRKWWNRNGYKILRVIFFPVWICSVIKEKITSWLNARQVWSEERAREILNYYVPRRANWNEEYKSFFFFDNGYGWNIHLAKKFLKRKDRRFWKVHSSFSGGEIRRYLINDFELEGFMKLDGDHSCGWTELQFKMIEKKED